MQPRLVAVPTLKVWEVRSFILTLHLDSMYEDWTIQICADSNENSQFTCSKAFSASKKTTMAPNLLMKQ